MSTLSLPPSLPPWIQEGQKKPRHFSILGLKRGFTRVGVNFQYSFVQYWRQPQSCLHCNVNDQTWTEALTGIGKKCLLKTAVLVCNARNLLGVAFHRQFSRPYIEAGNRSTRTQSQGVHLFLRGKEHSEMSDNDKAYYFNNGALTFTFAYLSLFGLSAE